MTGIVRILFYIFIFFVVLIPIALVIFFILKSRKSAWKGEIVGKKELD